MRVWVSGTAISLMFAAPGFAQNAADEFYDADEMATARAALYENHGNQSHFALFAERLELAAHDGDEAINWEGQAWLGGDLRKLWLKTEGEYSLTGSELQEAELQALYSRAISPFWDLQLGVRHDFRPDPSRTYVAVGVQGLAPHWFEVDGALFLSERGDLSARFEAEYDVRLAQRWLLQPRIEINAAFSDDDEIGVGSGLSTTDLGLRLRYEIRREVAPYLGVSWSRAFGDTADFRLADGGDTSEFSILLGLRFWF